MHLGNWFDEYEDLIEVAAEVGNTEGLRMLLDLVPPKTSPGKTLRSKIKYDDEHKEAVKLLLDRYMFSEHDLSDIFMRLTPEAQNELFPFIIRYEKYKEVPGPLAKLAMRKGNIDLLKMILEKGEPIQPEFHRDIILNGFEARNVDGLDLFLKNVKVDPRILEQFCHRAKHEWGSTRDLEAVLCTTQEWLEEQFKEPGCE
jgi:hypothetical protein